MICFRHNWKVETTPVDGEDYLSLLIEKPELAELFLYIGSIKRICTKCGYTQEYEPPHVCGGKKWRWC